MSRWTFLSNHAHVLLCIYRDPTARLRDVSAEVGITERAAQRIVSELEEEGYLTRERSGRRNAYKLNPDVPLRHPLESGHSVGELLEVLAASRGTGGARRSGSSVPARTAAEAHRD